MSGPLTRVVNFSKLKTLNKMQLSDALKSIETWHRETSLPAVLLHCESGLINSVYDGRFFVPSRNIKNLMLDEESLVKVRQACLSDEKTISSFHYVSPITGRIVATEVEFETIEIDGQRWAICRMLRISSLLV